MIPAAVFAAALEVPNRSESTSGQFAVYAASGTTRSKTSVKAEDFKKAFMDLLHLQEDGWKIPIILNLGAPPPDSRRPPRFNLGMYEGDAGAAKIQLDVFDLDFLKTSEFDTQLLNAIVLEYSYRNSSVVTGRAVEMPAPWLVDGLLERILSRQNGLKSSVYSSLLAGGKPPRMEDFINTDPSRLDPTSRAMYRAEAAAFVEAILDLPEGHKGLRQFLSKPRKSRGSMNDLVDAFPSLEGKGEGLNRKWVLAIARASAANRVDSMSIAETSSRLAEVLSVKPLPDPKHPEVAAMSGPYALEAIARSQNGAFILNQLSDDLLRLSIRSHPLYKALVDEYLSIVRELIAKPKRRVDKRVASAEEMRANLASHTGEMKDYLDWIEANRLAADNEDVAAAVEEIEEIEEPPPRTDAISRYIDAIAARGW